MGTWRGSTNYVYYQGQLDEVRRDLVTVRTEKTRLEEKVDTLEAAHDRLVQMKVCYENGFIITWILIQIIMLSNELKLKAG